MFSVPQTLHDHANVQQHNSGDGLTWIISPGCLNETCNFGFISKVMFAFYQVYLKNLYFVYN